MKKTDQKFEPTYQNAITAKKNGALAVWVQELLRSEGSQDLANSISKESPLSVEIYDFPLEKLNKIVGPEEQEEHRQSPDVWEERVSKIAEMIENGFEPAPLIVTDYWNHFEIADGNHRQEAMLRIGRTHYWTIFFIKHMKGREYIDKIMKNNPSQSGLL